MMERRLIPAKPRSKKQIEALATSITLQFQPSILRKLGRFDIERFFDLHLEGMTGVTIAYEKLGPGIYGYTDSAEMMCVISSDLAENEEQEFFYRSTQAHESGHAILHIPDYRTARASIRSVNEKDHFARAMRASDIVTYKNPEWQAWHFAGALLMPAGPMTAAYRKGCSINDLSQVFGVNWSFVKSRLRALELEK